MALRHGENVRRFAIEILRSGAVSKAFGAMAGRAIVAVQLARFHQSGAADPHRVGSRLRRGGRAPMTDRRVARRLGVGAQRRIGGGFCAGLVVMRCVGWGNRGDYETK